MGFDPRSRPNSEGEPREEPRAIRAFAASLHFRRESGSLRDAMTIRVESPEMSEAACRCRQSDIGGDVAMEDLTPV